MQLVHLVHLVHHLVQGHGAGVLFTDMQAHSLKPSGGTDMQFNVTENLIRGFGDADGHCVAARHLHVRVSLKFMQKMSILIGGQFCPWLSTLQSRWRPSKVIIIIIIIISIRFCNMRSSKNLGCGFVLQNWSYLLSQVGDTRRGGRLNTAWSLHPRSPPSLSHCWPRSHPGENIFAISTLTCQNCETSERKERC